MSEIRTNVAIGATDGFRYIAVKPPLNKVEIDLLVDKGIIASAEGQVEQVALGYNCSMLRGGWDTKRAQKAAQEIATLLRPARGSINVDVNPVELSGFQSSPFNPVTR